MYLRKDVKMALKGPSYFVKYCKDCDSEEIETVHRCKKCGSLNVRVPENNFIDTYDWKENHIKQDVTKETVSIFKCDKCNKEYEATSYNNQIFFSWGEDKFQKYPTYYDSDYGTEITSIEYPIPDLCSDCTDKLIKKLNKDLTEITQKTYVEEIIDKWGL